MMDTQTIELVGQHRLASELLRAGLEVAFPARDRGVDLIAYADVDQQAGHFVAKPIQLKAASRASFGIWSKYEKIHDLILAYVWHLDGEQDPITYALTCEEALAVGREMGWTQTASWTEQGAYTTTRPGTKLCEQLERYRMSPDKWRTKVTTLAMPAPASLGLSECLSWPLTGDPIEDAFHACALRFHGYRWTNAAWPEWEQSFGEALEETRKTSELPDDVFKCFAIFFLLQRTYAREEGWFSGDHQFRELGAWLYLHLYRLPTPQPYRQEEYERAWRSIQGTEREQVASWVRRWLRGARVDSSR